jgi:hypothetical protein
MCKMRNTHSWNWEIARKLTNEENETHTLEHPEYGKKTEKCGTGDTHTVGPGIWREN